VKLDNALCKCKSKPDAGPAPFGPLAVAERPEHRLDLVRRDAAASVGDP